MLTVHHLDNSRSQRVLWLLEELGVPYEIKQYKRQKNLLAPPDLKAVHPLGKAPVITDAGHTIAETGAIFDYILSTYGNGRLMPADAEARLRYTYWMYAAEGTFMPPLVMRLVMTQVKTRAPFFVRPVAAMIAQGVERAMITPNVTAALKLWETSLQQTGWFAGDAFSAADIMMSFPVETAAARAGAGERPRLRTWLDAVHARPAYQRALDRGGAYAYA